MPSGVRFFCLYLLVAAVCLAGAQESRRAGLWLTTADGGSPLAEETPIEFRTPEAGLATIAVDDRQRFQRMEGFGFALTGGSAQLLMKMDPAARGRLLHELVDTSGAGIGVSYLRVSIGSSDMNDHPFTYDDLPPGETDEALSRFGLGPDRTTVVPVLREILAINPSIRILGSPWSAPAWMKSNAALKGGELEERYYEVYARYLVTYLKAMEAEGIHLDAITVQNEPLNANNTPSMVMEAGSQARFIREALGPAFRRAGIRTRILVYDHNCDRPDYPLAVLKDPEAAQYVAGSAFHLYEGQVDALSRVHEAFPAKNVYFTEQMVVDRGHGMPAAAPVARIIIGATRNWSVNVLLWNLAADPSFGPHTGDGGCNMCEGAVTLDGSRVRRNVAWYAMAHASRFVRPGSVRIGSSGPGELPSVAFETPEGGRVLIVANPGDGPERFQILDHGRAAVSLLAPGAVGTYVW